MFAGANGSMMIEVVPFFHILVNSIVDHVGEDNPEAVIATTMVAFALSSIMTGMSEPNALGPLLMLWFQARLSIYSDGLRWATLLDSSLGISLSDVSAVLECSS